MIVLFGFEKLILRKAGEKKRDQLTHIFLCYGVNVAWEHNFVYAKDNLQT
jgi:hypothetical protein